MLGGRESAFFILAIGLAAAPARAQAPLTMTVDDERAVAEVTPAVSLQAPPDVNQPPVCQRQSLPCLSGRTFGDGGLALSTTIYPGDTIGIVGEASVYANHWVTYGTNCVSAGGSVPRTCPADATNAVRSMLVGVRVRSRPMRIADLHGRTRARLFAQALAGPQWSDVGPRRRAVQPGGGIDHYLRNGVIVRVELDYRFAPGAGRDLSTARGVLGIALPIGSR